VRIALITLISLGFPTLSYADQIGPTPKSSLEILKVPSPEKDFPFRTVDVWTPAVPANEIPTLPVVYFLHGWPGTPNGIMGGTLPSLAAAFAEYGKAFIAVFPDGNAKTHIDSEWADSYDGAAMIETWLTTNVIKTVEAGDIRPAADRAIFGFSMGGYGAAIIGLHHPELFGQIITLAGYFVTDDLTNAFGGASHPAKVAYQTPSNFLSTANKSRWFLSESSGDFTPLIHNASVKWAAKLKAVKASYVLDEQPGGHTYVYVAREIPHVIQWLKWPAFAAPALATPTPTPTPSVTPVIAPVTSETGTASN
jgi:S-formylglutathione hydrolase FrmB